MLAGVVPRVMRAVRPSCVVPLTVGQRTFTTERTYGNLKDSDRIFTNLYGEHDIFIKGALKRVREAL